jgi:uncharacterized membrane protein YidH (DUF202 family)
MAPPDDPEDLDPGLARARTQLAWTRTAISFAAVGAVILKSDPAAGLTVLALSPLIWALAHLFTARTADSRHGRLLLVAVTVTAVSLVTLAVAVNVL